MAVLNQLNQYGVGFQVKVMSSLLKHKEFLLNNKYIYIYMYIPQVVKNLENFAFI
jgi:hypothetical protein